MSMLYFFQLTCLDTFFNSSCKEDNMELSVDVSGSVGVDEVEEGISWYCCVFEDAVFALKSLVLVGE